MEFVALILDIILLGGGVLAMYYARMVGGGIGQGSLTLMAVGFLMLGFAHLAETIIDQLFPDLGHEANEIIHRLIVAAGFFLLLFGYQKLAKFARS